MDESVPHLRRCAYYYSNRIWTEASIDFVKTSLLFFDGVALSVPGRKLEEIVDTDPCLARPLYDRGLLVNVDPAVQMNPTIVEGMGRVAARFVIERTFHSPRLISEVGTMAAWRLARKCSHALLEHANEHGLGAFHRGGQLSAFSKRAQAAIQYLYAQLLAKRSASPSQALAISPITDASPSELRSTISIVRRIGLDQSLRLPPARARGMFDQISTELAVPLDVSRIPLDEILDFKKEFAPHVRAYMKSLDEYMQVVEGGDVNVAHAEMERMEELKELRSALQRSNQRSNSRIAVVVTLSFVSAILGTLSHDAAPAIASLLAALAGAQTTILIVM